MEKQARPLPIASDALVTSAPQDHFVMIQVVVVASFVHDRQNVAEFEHHMG